MPNVNTVSFGPGLSNVDLQAQQAQLQRQQAIADMLRQQATTPTETQMVSGRAVKNSPWLGVAQLGKALLANRMQGKNDEKQTELGTIAAKRSADALRALAPAGIFDESAPSGAPSGPPMGEPGSAPVQTPQPQQAAPQYSPEMREKWARALTLSQTNPELGNKLIQNLVELTGNQKDWAAQGIDPRALGAAMLNKEKAGGLVNVAPNATVLDAGTNKPVFAAPDFASGRANTFGPNGAPQVSLMQGSDVIPQQAGAIEAAKAGAQAANEMVTVNTPQGPQMMTRAQAVQLSGGQQQRPMQPPQQPQQNQGFPTGTQLPAPTPGMQNRTEILKQELAAAMADPRRAGDIPLIQRELAGAGGVGSMPGIPLQTAAQAEQQVGNVKNALEIEKSRVLNAQSPEQIQKLADAQGVVGLAGMARKVLEDGKATGSLGGTLRDKVVGSVGVSTKSSQAASQLAAIGASLTSKMPKMSGPQSDKDVLEYRTMAGRVGDSSLPVGDRLAALGVVESINQKYLSQNQNSIAAEAQGANTRNGPIRKYNPATGRIE